MVGILGMWSWNEVMRVFRRISPAIVATLLSAASVTVADESLSGFEELNYFASPQEFSEGKWRKSDEAERKKAYDFARAEVVKEKGVVRRIDLSFSSQSGDWETQQTYCLNANGSVENFHQEHVTFLGYNTELDEELKGGPFKVITEKEYKSQGKIRSISEKAIRKSDGKEVPVKYIQRSPVPEYRQLDEFGF